MICRCGHELQQHSDRALFPACEGAHDDVGPLLVQLEDYGPESAYVRHAPRSRNEACDCKGFKSA